MIVTFITLTNSIFLYTIFFFLSQVGDVNDCPPKFKQALYTAGISIGDKISENPIATLYVSILIIYTNILSLASLFAP